MFGRSPKKDINLLLLVPERRFTHEVNEEGLVVVEMPRFHVKWMQDRLIPKSKHPYIRISLDPFGSFVWLQLDGAHSVGDIADALVAHFGEEVNPVHERLSTFIHQLQRRGFVTLRDEQGVKY